MAIPVGTQVEMLKFPPDCTNRIGTVVECADRLCCPDTAGQAVPEFRSKVEYMFESCGQCKMCEHIFCDIDLAPVSVPLKADNFSDKVK